MLCTWKAEKNILRTKQRYYELVEKAHKALSWQLKTEKKLKNNHIQNESEIS